MSRTTLKFWKFLIHAFCIILTVHNINNRLNYTKIIKFDRFLTDIKHILIWTDLPGVTHEGQTHFIKKKCSQFNCYFTRNRAIFGDLRYFDAIVFNAPDLKNHEKFNLPNVRGVNQVYIFASKDSPDKYPVCHPVYDGFFNWTWTYRHDSTVSYRFITVYNNRSQELGSHFHWPPIKQSVNDRFKLLLMSKFRAAAIFLDECTSNSNREGLIMSLQNEMNIYNLTIDIFGACGKKTCKRRTFATCNWRLKKQYYFFLAFEDSIDYDYVTTSVAMAYKNNVVPIVYGGADYYQYLPPDSYIDAKKLTVKEVVAKMHESIMNKEKYYEYFKWHNFYNIRESSPLDACGICSKLAERPQLIGRTSYKKFREWWWPKYRTGCLSEG